MTSYLTLSLIALGLIAAGAALCIWSWHLPGMRAIADPDSQQPAGPDDPPCDTHGWDCLLTDYQPHTQGD